MRNRLLVSHPPSLLRPLYLNLCTNIRWTITPEERERKKICTHIRFSYFPSSSSIFSLSFPFKFNTFCNCIKVMFDKMSLTADLFDCQFSSALNTVGGGWVVGLGVGYNNFLYFITLLYSYSERPWLDFRDSHESRLEKKFPVIREKIKLFSFFFLFLFSRTLGRLWLTVG